MIVWELKRNEIEQLPEIPEEYENKKKWMLNVLEENLTEDEQTKWVSINCINSNLPFSKLDQKSFFLNSQGIDSYELELENINFNLNKKDKEITNQLQN